MFDSYDTVLLQEVKFERYYGVGSQEDIAILAEPKTKNQEPKRLDRQIGRGDACIFASPRRLAPPDPRIVLWVALYTSNGSPRSQRWQATVRCIAYQRSP